MAANNKLQPITAEQVLQDSRGLADLHDSISYVGGVRPDIAGADPDLLPLPGDETDDEDEPTRRR